MLWFAVWLGWRYTAWGTNWFNLQHLGIRCMLFGLVMATAIPVAFGGKGALFAIACATLQIGRSGWVLLGLRRDDPLRPNLLRIFGWLCISGVLWLAGGFSDDASLRLGFWIAAVGCEYISPMFGFRLAGLGRSVTTDWKIAGGHLAERCQLFMIVALGESLLASGAASGAAENPGTATYIALATAFVGSVAMWWICFDTSSEDGTRAITAAADPGRMGAWSHYLHVALIAGVIVVVVADEQMIHHPRQAVDAIAVWLLIGGPLLYLLAGLAYKKVVYDRLPLSHIVGVLLLATLIRNAPTTDRLVVGGLTTAVLVPIAAWQSWFAATSARPAAVR